MLRKLIRILFNRNTMFMLLLLLQATFLVLTVLFLSQHYVEVYAALTVLNLLLAVYISNTAENPSYKMPWLLLMLVFPLYTGLAYLLIKTDIGHRMFKKNYARRVVETKKYLPQNYKLLDSSHMHTWGEWVPTKAATCAEEGSQTRTCSGCNTTQTQPIAKDLTAHKYVVDSVVAATYDAQGYTVYK